METAPDVLGMRIEEAERELRRAGVSYLIKKTAPPGRCRYSFAGYRVIRQSDGPDGTELLVCEV